jgi:2'-5' RNA ligase
MRLFIAINFSNDMRLRLLALRDELRGRAKCGNFSASENLHLTLAFLGECDNKQTITAKSALSAVSFEPFNIVALRVGCFTLDGSDIWWAGLRENEQLLALQQDLADKLTTAGFTLERRKFSPHITLGRKVVTNAKPWVIEPFGETVSTIELMKSERIRGKLTYTAIDTRRAIL